MGLLRELIGLLFVVLAWFNPFSLGIEFQLLFFILGFDFMSLIPKIAVFVIDFIFDFSGIGWILLLVVAVEAFIQAFDAKPIIGYILKPMAVFLILYVNNIGIAIAFIVAGIDLLMNVSKQYI